LKKALINRIIAITLITWTVFTTGISTRTAFAESANDQLNQSGYVFGNVNITGGGYVENVIFNKSEKDLAYLRTDMGGVYKWDTEKNKWAPLTDWISSEDWNLLGCESVATDAVDPNRVYIVAGTYTNNWTTQNGYLLRSANRGDDFEKIELPFKTGGNMPGRNMGERLNIDPNDNRVLYLGARSGHGLWKSTDYGSTWQKVESFPAIGDYADEWSKDPIGIAWTVFDPTSSQKGQPCQTIYVGAANAGKENTVFCSRDGGATWSAVEGQPTYDWEPTKDAPGNYMPHHAALGLNGMLYISYNNQEGPYNGNRGGVWKYNTKTNEWTNITPKKPSEGAYWGYGGITVDSVNPNIIMTSTLNSYYPDGNIYRSIDGGKTWNAFFDFDKNIRKNNYRLDYKAAPWLDWGSTEVEAPKTSPKLGWMIGDIQIDPFDSNHIVYGTGATLYGSHNATNLDEGRKIDISVQAQGVEETAVLKLVSLPSGDAKLLSGTGDIGGFVHMDLDKSPNMLTNPTLGNCQSLDYAELNPNIIIRVGDFAVMGISKDGGKTWKETTGKLDIKKEEGGNYLEVGGTAALSADGSTILYSPNGADVSVVYSTDDGATWNKSVGIPPKAKICSDRVNPKKFYGILDGDFYGSADGGATFEKTATSLYKEKIDISAMPGVEGDIWFAGGGIWHSTDSGKTFEKLSTVENASIIGFGKAAPGKDYMSLYTNAKINGVSGIFRSDDKGVTWIRINDERHQYGVANTAITGDKREYGKFYLGTNGRGIVYGELAK